MRKNLPNKKRYFIIKSYNNQYGKIHKKSIDFLDILDIEILDRF